ncbi:MAG: lipid A deacylase LpxR family protein [Chitinophagaceae bacterium]|nr:MAG: lipid A deacylase LpxR family protein [Chitinophagaceae bacterium]
MRKIIFCSVFCAVALSGFGQRVENLSGFRNAGSDHYLRLHYDNDYFTKTDRYYTQGITLEYAAPGLKNFFLSRLMLTPFTSAPSYGMTLNIFAFTPTSIEEDQILYGDRPFDANMAFQVFSIQADPDRRQRLSTTFTLGIMGRYAFGYDIQYGIHKWTGNPLPRGWQYQVRTDAIVNYQVNYEKELFSRKGFLVNAAAEGRLGTLNDKINAGVNLMAGRFRKPFQATASRKTEYYFFLQGRTNLVGYDATLQGGLFNKSTPYTISTDDISRVVFQADAGVIVNFRKLLLSYTQSFITKEFATGELHRWGGVSMGLRL